MNSRVQAALQQNELGFIRYQRDQLTEAEQMFDGALKASQEAPASTPIDVESSPQSGECPLPQEQVGRVRTDVQAGNSRTHVHVAAGCSSQPGRALHGSREAGRGRAGVQGRAAPDTRLAPPRAGGDNIGVRTSPHWAVDVATFKWRE